MLHLPPGFDYNLLLSDLWACVLPFVPIAILFAAYGYIKRIMRNV